MGFFSWDCKACGHPLLSPYVINEVNSWMNDAVALLPNGSRMQGTYDGYGRLGGFPIDNDGVVEVYHLACYRKCGEPPYSSPSQASEDQGYFFSDGDHDVPRERAGPPPEERWEGVDDPSTTFTYALDFSVVVTLPAKPPEAVLKPTLAWKALEALGATGDTPTAAAQELAARITSTTLIDIKRGTDRGVPTQKRK